MSRFYALVLFTGLLFLTSCAELPDSYGLYQEPPSAWTIEQNNNRLLTIEALVQTGKSSAAKQQADLINLAELTAPQAAKYNLLNAQIMLSFGEAEYAIKKLAKIDAGQLETGDKIKNYQSQAFAYSLTGNLLESAKARIILDPLLTKAVERNKNQAVILENLALLPSDFAPKIQNQTADFPSWFTLAKILASRTRNPANYSSALANWRTANPQHPANIYVANMTNRPEDAGNMPKSIAILLPESGPFADAGKAIKAGFLAALNRYNSGTKPEIHFYDTEKTKSADAYRKAVEQGAKLVLGPLNKESIQSLANAVTFDVPVLALNHIPSLNKPNLYQFALSPMDDVAELTQKAASDGHKKALLLVPESEQSKRISSFFINNWQTLNGSITKSATYNPKSVDFSSTAKNLLNPDESGASPQNGQNALSPAQAAPQQQDTGALFLSAYSKEGRIINAQLQIMQNGKLPVYALPTIYSGVADPINDNALNGVIFCDMPWLFNAAYGGELSMLALNNEWRQFPNSYLRLFAMGIDAYQLASRLTTLNAEPYAGATGKLTLASGNRIKRALVCAKFVMGRPELIGFTHSPSEGQ